MYLVVLAIFSVALSIWWLAKYRQTSRDSDMKRLLDLKGGTPNIQDLGIHVLPCLREFGAESLMHM